MPQIPYIVEGNVARIADPFTIPTAPKGIAGAGCPLPSRKFRWLNSQNQNDMAMHMMSYGERPGYEIVAGKTVKETTEIAIALGFNIGYVDVAKNRIAYAELVLASVPVAEHERRKAEAITFNRGRISDADEAYLARMDALPTDKVRGFRRQYGEIHERREHSERPGKPFVSLTKVDA